MIRLTIVITLLCTFAFMLGSVSGEAEARNEREAKVAELEKRILGDL